MVPEEVMLNVEILRLNRGELEKERGDNVPSRGIAMFKGVELGRSATSRKLQESPLSGPW